MSFSFGWKRCSHCRDRAEGAAIDHGKRLPRNDIHKLSRCTAKPGYPHCYPPAGHQGLEGRADNGQRSLFQSVSEKRQGTESAFAISALDLNSRTICDMKSLHENVAYSSESQDLKWAATTSCGQRFDWIGTSLFCHDHRASPFLTIRFLIARS